MVDRRKVQRRARGVELPLRRFAHDDGDRPVRAADDADAEVVLRLGRKGSGLTFDLARASFSTQSSTKIECSGGSGVSVKLMAVKCVG